MSNGDWIPLKLPGRPPRRRATAKWASQNKTERAREQKCRFIKPNHFRCSEPHEPDSQFCEAHSNE